MGARARPDPEATTPRGLLVGRPGGWLAILWGFCEATFFFIVPDVLLTLMASRSMGVALRGVVLALAGALIGGALMYDFGQRNAERARDMLVLVPGIDEALVHSVEVQVEDRAGWALALGILRGRPYKVYAVEWGASDRPIGPFLFASFMARFVRFSLTSLLAWGVVRALRRWIGESSRTVVLAVWAASWVAFYLWYFSVYGW